MNVEQIQKIEQLIPLEPGKELISHTVKRLTGPGDNYGSLMLSVELILETSTGTEKTSVVAKMVPPNEFIQRLFNIQVTFRNEIAFYKHIVPVLQNFQRENGVVEVLDFAPKYYGSRISLDPNSTKVDLDGSLVLENLKLSNYVTPNRLVPLDYEPTKLVLLNLAQFHAVPLALRLKKPEVFEKEIQPYLKPWQFQGRHVEGTKKTFERLIEQVPDLKPLKDRIVSGIDRIIEPHDIRETFATVTHNDCWSNNNMFQLDDINVVKSKMVDYQMCSYGSPGKDIVFLLFLSVKSHVIEKYYDELIKLYYEKFVSVLEELNCDTKLFSFEGLQKELDFEAKYSQFGHIGFKMFAKYQPKEEVSDIMDIKPDWNSNKTFTDLHKKHYLFFIDQFVKRNWI